MKKELSRLTRAIGRLPLKGDLMLSHDGQGDGNGYAGVKVGRVSRDRREEI